MDGSPPSSEKRRRRPPLACIACRRRKVRCDRKLPCQNCVRARRATSCAYVPDERIEPRDGIHGFADGINGRDPQCDGVVSGPYLSPTASHNSTSNPSSEQLSERVKQLEKQLTQVLEARSGKKTAAQSVLSGAEPPSASRFLAPEHWQVGSLGTLGNGVKAVPCPNLSDNTEEDISAVNANAILAKSRYLGNSHWIHGVTLFPRLMMFLQTLESDKHSEAFQAVAASKALGRQIKAARVPTMVSLEFGKHIPPKELADDLLESYFRTFETVYRILHVPSFRLEYNRYWQNPKGAREAFIIQLQLCMAIGAVLHDDTYSLRGLAVRWVYEARLWILKPSEKSRLNLSGLQAWCLIHLSRDVCGIGGDLVWASAGTMMRMALYIGLHRDPVHLPKMSLLAAETRRRVWATVLEILVQSSMDSGGPPLISTNDYDTQPPGNYNDEDLLNDTASSETPQPKPIGTFTDTSIQIAILKCIKIRLDIAAYLNEFRSITSYDKSLSLNSGLTTASRGLDALVRVYQSQQPGPSSFQLRVIEHMIQRYFLALHLPWLGSAREDPRYYFSRKMCVEIGLRYHKEAKAHGYLSRDDGTFEQPDDYGRLLICGSGGFRYIGTQCLLTATLELLWELEERIEGARSLGLGDSSSFGATPSVATPSSASTPGVSIGLLGASGQDGEMLDILRHSAAWMKARIKAGEVNIKGYLFTRAMLAEAEGLAAGATEEEVEHALKERCIEAAKDSLNMLKEMYAAMCNGGPLAGETDASGRATSYTGMNGTQIPVNGVEVDYPALDTTSSGQMSSDWDWDIMQDPGFNFNFNLSLGGMDLVFGNPPSMY
ncbi:hypothetical protein VP1G_01931 [Cytospora mali]|uniref:Zn(2)-C6 fungal-type domain-containing protein n=1 Tax=Cytospora mali TaxID=578113 RepID=A0A194USH1_CYTMA|nr:hypothetical protein VP1G_01931 [Valsa mali var. pyri (nom. inval.)]